MKINFSSMFNLNTADFLKGILMAVISAVLTAVYTGFQSGAVDWNSTWKLALTTAIAYLLKNFFTPPPDVVVIDPNKTTVQKKVD